MPSGKASGGLSLRTNSSSELAALLRGPCGASPEEQADARTSRAEERDERQHEENPKAVQMEIDIGQGE